MAWVRVFVDTSVLLAGLASPRGAANLILTLAEAELLALVLSEEVLIEAERNLQRRLPAALPYYQEWLAASPVERVPSPTLEEVLQAARMIHPKDAAILVAAMSAGVNYLVTLDRRHFLDDPEVTRRSGLRIGTPGDFIAWFRVLLEQR